MKAIQPIPAVKPVINLSQLVLSLSKKAWVKPSIIVGSINTILSHKLRLKKPNKKIGKLK